MSSIESAPVAIPATSAPTFNPAFAPLSVGTLSPWSASRPRPACSANATSGTSPADDTRFGSSEARPGQRAGVRQLHPRDALSRYQDRTLDKSDRGSVRGHFAFRPAAQQPRSSVDRGLAERVAAGAGAGRVRVVDREALLLDRVDEVDGRAAQVRGAHAVGDDLDATEVLDNVPVEGTLVEEELVTQAGAAAGLNGDAQGQVVTAFLVEQGLDLRRGGVGQDDAVGDGAGLVRYGHLHLSRVVRRLLADWCNRQGRGFIPGRAPVSVP